MKLHKSEPITRYFRLIRDTPNLSKGSIFFAKGGSDFYEAVGNVTLASFLRSNVEDNPNWFVEVFKVYLTADQLTRAHAAHRDVTGQVNKYKASWTPKRRAEQGERTRKMWAAKRRAAKKHVKFTGGW